MFTPLVFGKTRGFLLATGTSFFPLTDMFSAAEVDACVRWTSALRAIGQMSLRAEGPKTAGIYVVFRRLTM
ncbi:MAG: hypothetical protein AAFQ82_25210 [Myxococcota bacterium]